MSLDTRMRTVCESPLPRLIESVHGNFWREMFPPTTLTYEEIKSDCDRIITGIARQYTDKSCVELHEEELIAEGNRKLCENINKGILSRFAGRRSELFRWITACVNNHVKGLVHKYRFTYKRTGYSPPPKDAVAPSRPKPEISLDDPETNVHLPPQYTTSELSALRSDMQALLNVTEFSVFSQLIEPNWEALNYAYNDSHRGHKKRNALELRVTTEHLARGIGLSTEFFLETQIGIQAKLQKYMQDPTVNSPQNAAISALERIFGLHIPASMVPIEIRRTLTFAARDQFEKVDEKVRTLLKVAGARLPEILDNSISCFGVLYNKGNSICESCGVKQSCAVEAANVGLGMITLSPKMLKANNVRTTQFYDNDSPHTLSLRVKPPALAPTPAPVELPAPVIAPKPVVPAPAKASAVEIKPVILVEHPKKTIIIRRLIVEKPAIVPVTTPINHFKKTIIIRRLIMDKPPVQPAPIITVAVPEHPKKTIIIRKLIMEKPQAAKQSEKPSTVEQPEKPQVTKQPSKPAIQLVAEKMSPAQLTQLKVLSKSLTDYTRSFPPPTPPPPPLLPVAVKPPKLVVAMTERATPLSSREEELEAYLRTNFKANLFTNELYFRHRNPRADGSIHYCFWLGRAPIENGHWALRFCRPSDDLKKKLLAQRISYYLPPALPVDKAIELIEQHANDSYRAS